MKITNWQAHTRLTFVISILLLYFSTVASLAAQNFQSELIQAQSLNKTIKRSGKIAFKRTVNLSFKSSGYLAELYIDEGESFKNNQLLAALDITELKEEKNSAYASLLQAKREVNRQKSLLAKKLSSEQALELANTEVDVSRAAYKVAYYNLEKAKLVAPFDGVVIRRFTDLGELQSPSQVTLQVASSLNNLVVRLALTAEEIPYISLHQKVEIQLADYGVLGGRVSRVPAMADEQSHLFIVEVLLPELPQLTKVLPGQFVDILIDVASSDYVYPLPIAALNRVDDEGSAVVTLLDGEDIRQKSFVINKVTNRFIYLQATKHSPALTFVTQGWQQVSSLNANKEPN